MHDTRVVTALIAEDEPLLAAALKAELRAAERARLLAENALLTAA
jgi:hypothetical protein